MSVRRAVHRAGAQLRTTGPFSILTQNEATALRISMEPVTLATGEPLIRQGDVGDDLFVVESGRLRVQATQDGQQSLDAACSGGSLSAPEIKPRIGRRAAA
jgi:CRP-like cAMP-binding protein